MRRNCLTLGLALSMLTLSAAASAQEDNGGSNADANNPLANMTAFNLHGYFIPEFTGLQQAGNQGFIRFAKPFNLGGDWLMRATLPVPTLPGGTDGTSTGLGVGAKDVVYNEQP